MPKVKIDGEFFNAEKGELLSNILIKAKKATPHPCGGMGVCKKCTVFVNGKKELSCQYKITDDAVVELLDEGSFLEAALKKDGHVTENVCFCLDIGTTTLALALVSQDEKKIIDVKTAPNPQRKFGADVISRIAFCKENGVEKLQEPLIEAVNSLLSAYNVNTARDLFVAGNTTMLHTFFGVDCTCLGTFPYTPKFLESKTEQAEALGIACVERVISLPCISAFIGADIVAGLNLIKKEKTKKFSLLLDLGTNAEIVLFSENKFYCTSAAAGPCFEGVNISQGMGATNGAIYSYKDGVASVIGNTVAKGICGTGLIDVIAELLKKGVIDETGFLEAEEEEIANGVFIERNDVRQYQLAKSAVYSAISVLLNTENISFDDIEALYVSGGFSAKLNMENAAFTGLLPQELKEKCVFLNNSSLLGTVRYACEGGTLESFVKKAECADLSASELFSKEFLKNMNFQHQKQKGKMYEKSKENN